MHRILIMGPPGSGKSTFARTLGARIDTPVFHLDQAYHQPGWVPVPDAVFLDRVARMVALPAWIIDGNYTGLLGARLQRADTIIYLDVPTWFALLRVLRRLALHFGRVRPHAAAGCPERLDLEFLGYVWSWNRLRRTKNLERLRTFEGRTILLRSTRDHDDFWRRIDRPDAPTSNAKAPPC